MKYKSNGIIIRCPKTVCRLEERKHPAEKPAVQFVDDTFNPSGRYERGWFVDLDSRLNEVNDTLKRLIVAVTRGTNYDLSRRGDLNLMRQPTNRKYFSWFVRHLEDITAEHLMKALESEESRSSPKDFLLLAKMLCAKKGMPHKEWEELSYEQKMRQSLRQMGISEDFVTEIVSSLIHAVFDGINGQIRSFLSFDERRELKCSICPEKPYKAWTIMRAKQGSDIYNAIVAVLCKKHFKRVAVRPDKKLIHTIAEAAMQSRQQV